MRTISSDALAKLSTNIGIEPVCIIGIQWVPNGQVFYYADKDIPTAAIPGKILALSDLDDDVQITYNAQSASIDITLDDIDGSIKDIVDNNDIHLRPCWVYQWFEGLDISDKFLLFKGEINTPITWKEGDRSISFTVISKIEDIDVGFSIEQGNFFIPDPSMVGKAWPLCFGTVTNVPAFKLVPPVSGILATGVGIADFTLGPRIELAKDTPCPMVSAGEQVVWTTGSPGFAGGPQGFQDIEQVYVPDPNCVKQQCNEIAQWQNQLAAQEAFEIRQITIFGGERFPQGTELALNINGGIFIGVMEGEIFTIAARIHPNLVVKPAVQEPLDVALDYPACEESYAQLISEEVNASPLNGNPGYGLTSVMNYRGDYDPGAVYSPFDVVKLTVDGITQSYVCTVATVGHSPFDTSFWNELPLAVGSRYQYDQGVLNALPQAGFFWANAGATVTVQSGEPLVYIANILPSSVLRVAAFRQLDVGPVLVTVPPEYYELQLVDYTGYTMTQITLPFALSAYGTGWSDDLYVTLTSAVGPNTVDIMEWLITTYSAHGIDSTSFNHVKTLVDNYPMHFALLERQSLIQTLQQIAYQARCALQLRDDTFYLTYLPETPTAVDTIEEGDIIYDAESGSTLELFHTPTEDLVTDYTVTYTDDYAAQPYTLIYRHNVAKYATIKAQDNFYTFNILELVRKAATFWLIRRSNTWRMVRLSTPLSKLAIEVGDAVTLNLPQIAPNPVTGICYKAAYNSDSHTIDFEFWTPLLSGTKTPYIFAFPKDVSELEIFPTPDEREKGFAGGGPGPNFITAPPLPQLGSGGNQGASTNIQMGAMDCNGQNVRLSRLGNVLDPSDFNDGQCHNDFGASKPSDQGDTKPTPNATSDDSDAQATSNPLGPGTALGNSCCQQALDQAQSAMQQANKALQAAANAAPGGGDGGSSDPNDLTGKVPSAAQARKNSQCTFTVQLTYWTVSKVFNSSSGFSTTPGTTGTVVDKSGVRTSETVFGSNTAAEDFLSAQQKQIQSTGTVGQEAMVSVARRYTPGASDAGKTDCGTANNKVVGYTKSV
jgi:hypothetical protein